MNSFQGIWIDQKVWLLKDLSMIEKIMLSIISNLDNDKGCFASNNYFSEIMDLTPGRCSQVINSLKNKGYIGIKMIRKGKEIKKRVLKILNTGIKNTRGGIYYSKEGIENTREGYLENDKGIHKDIIHKDKHIINECKEESSQIVFSFYRTYNEKTNQMILPHENDFKKARDFLSKNKADKDILEKILSAIPLYFKKPYWFNTKNRDGKHIDPSTWNFGSFIANVQAILAAKPRGSPDYSGLENKDILI